MQVLGDQPCQEDFPGKSKFHLQLAVPEMPEMTAQLQTLGFLHLGVQKTTSTST